MSAVGDDGCKELTDDNSLAVGLNRDVVTGLDTVSRRDEKHTTFAEAGVGCSVGGEMLD